MWTQAWRRLNKKLRDDNVSKKRFVKDYFGFEV